MTLSDGPPLRGIQEDVVS